MRNRGSHLGPLALGCVDQSVVRRVRAQRPKVKRVKPHVPDIVTGDLFLTAAELVELTGYRRQHEQRRWLIAHRWRFEQNAAGAPRVARAYLERRMVGEVVTATPGPPARHNFEALRVVK